MTGVLPGRRLRTVWGWITTAPDEVLADAARDGEMLVARVRTWLTLLILIVPIVTLGVYPYETAHYLGLAVALIAVIASAVLDRAVRGGLHWKGLSVLTTVSDVTLVSLALFAFWGVGMPIVTVNSRVVFEVYFLAIGASALRYSPKICVLAGATAIAQYSALSLLTWSVYGPSDLTTGARFYGTLDWTTQVGRIVMLIGMTIVALAIVHRTTKLRKMSTSDRLTGLFNRGYIEEYLGHELPRSARTGEPLALAMLDVDRFKSFNDSHGHVAGDRALRQLATVLRGSLRRSDVIARYGGEEIVLALPGTDLASAIEKLDEVRVRIAVTDIPLPRGGSGRITVSIGVASLGADGATMDELLDAADGRLYEAKAAGRNRLVGPGA
jgi:diguanylate cyclase (GGDEF)-like protein